MDWVKQNYERAILAAAGLALLASSVLVFLRVQALPTNFEGRNSPKPPDHTIKPLPIEVLADAAKRVAAPARWETHDASLFVSLPYVLQDGNLINPLESDIDLHEPIKNSWLIKNSLPWWERDVRDQDPDEDRFSNLDEFVAGTDPRDKDSVPPYYTKLRLKKFISVPFRLRFTGTPDDGQSFTVNPLDGNRRTQILKIGDSIAGTPYKVVAFQAKTETVNEIDKDFSELTVENTENGNRVVLVRGKEANDPTSFAEFEYLYDNSTFKVKKDDLFELKPETDRKYKLIDISNTEAVIQDQKSKDQHKILLTQ
jgi:hypothetical protein